MYIFGMSGWVAGIRTHGTENINRLKCHWLHVHYHFYVHHFFIVNVFCVCGLETSLFVKKVRKYHRGNTKSKKNRQYNGQKTKGKQRHAKHYTVKLRIQQHKESHSKPGEKSEQFLLHM